MEIHLAPLPKAVFLLYLKHPEGILFKHLSEYKKELMEIYAQISNRESPAEMKKSIDDLVNSTKNSINEKCSRIREAFIKRFDERLAYHYFITGTRFTAKRIELDRNLVSWEGKI
jgi:regulator of sirC expression with transglutaminase-like and TPR domain